MDKLNWDHEPQIEEDTIAEPANIDAFYQALKIALQIQAQADAEMELAGQLGIGQ
jgi:hypothetical protein